MPEDKPRTRIAALVETYLRSAPGDADYESSAKAIREACLAFVSGFVPGWMYARYGNTAIADAADTAVIQYISSLEKLRKEGSLKCSGIVGRKVLKGSFYKSLEFSRPGGMLEVSDFDPYDEALPERINELNQTERVKVSFDEIEKALEGIQEPIRSVLTEGKNLCEAAEELGCSVEWVRQKVIKARASVASKLGYRPRSNRKYESYRPYFGKFEPKAYKGAKALHWEPRADIVE